MSDKSAKKVNVKVIIALLIVAVVASVGGYYIYNKTKDKNSASENGSSISGYVLSEGAEPGLSEEEINTL